MEELNETNFFKDLFKSKEQKEREAQIAKEKEDAENKLIANNKLIVDKYNAFNDNEKQQDFYKSLQIIERNIKTVVAENINKQEANLQSSDVELDSNGQSFLNKLTYGYYYLAEKTRQCKSYLFIYKSKKTQANYFVFITVQSLSNGDYYGNIHTFRINNYILNNFLKKIIHLFEDQNPYEILMNKGSYHYGDLDDIQIELVNNLDSTKKWPFNYKNLSACIEYEIAYRNKNKEYNFINRYGKITKKNNIITGLVGIKKILGDTGWLKLFIDYEKNNHIKEEDLKLENLTMWIYTLTYDKFKKILLRSSDKQALFASSFLPKL